MGEILVIFGLIVLNGLFSMSEMALISSRKTKIKNLANKGNLSASKLLSLIEDPNKFLSTIQIGITTIGILTGIYSGDVLADDFSAILATSGVNSAYSHIIAQTIIVVATTYFTLILGELLPKRLGMAGAEGIALAICYPMYWLSIIASPFVWLLSKSTKGLMMLFRFKEESNKVTEEEIKMVIQEGKESGEVQEVEQNIVDRVFLMGDMTIGSLKTHRNEITWLRKEMQPDEIRKRIESDIHNTYPIIGKDLDDIKGIVKLKDLVLHINKPDFELEKIVRPATYFYENASVYSVLETMKNNHINYALITNEFGDLEGVVTITDIMRGLVGDINENMHEPNIVKREDREEWLVNGRYSFSDFLNYFDMEEYYQQNKYNTINGLILDKINHIPTIGERIEWNDFIFEVADMDRARIDKLIVMRRQQQ